MPVKQISFCDHCNKEIKPGQGYQIQGNLYLITDNDKGGLIGNAFPKEKTRFSLGDIHTYVYCIPCFIDYLNDNSDSYNLFVEENI